jgi:hypothetical protein
MIQRAKVTAPKVTETAIITYCPGREPAAFGGQAPHAPAQKRRTELIRTTTRLDLSGSRTYVLTENP